MLHPGASRIPQLVESSLECKAHSPWNVREMTVTTWRNTGPPDASRETPWVLVCVQTVYLSGLGFCRDLTLARVGVGALWGFSGLDLS